MPRKRERPVVRVPLSHAMEMYAHGFAKISTGEVRLTAKGRRQLGKASEGVLIIISGMDPQNFRRKN